MYTALILFGVCLLVMVIFRPKKGSKDATSEGRRDWYGSILTVGVVAALVAPMIVDTFLPEQEYLQSTVELISLRGQTNTEGHFYLFSGSAEGVDYYYYYAEDAAGGYLLHKVGATGTRIVEEDRKDGRLYTYRKQRVYSYRRWGWGNRSATRYEFHIPRGTILREFRL